MIQQIQRDGKPITLIHFVSDRGGEYRIACMPGIPPSEFGETAYHPVIRHTNEFRAVTCPACKKSDPYLEAERAHHAATRK